MNIKVVGKNIEITEAIREYIEKRFEKFEKFELDNSEITVSCSVEREEQIVDIQINKSGDFIRIEERNNDLYASIDLAIDRVARQLRKDKEKKLDKSRNESLKDKIMGIFKDETPDRAGEITKTKVYEAKPLSIEDAKLKLMDKKEDEDVIVYSGHQVELMEAIQNGFLLNVSGKFLCSEDCKGLCPICGMNLNEGECDCEKDYIDPRLLKLAEIMKNMSDTE